MVDVNLTKSTIGAIIAGVVMIFVGLMAANIAGGIGQYVVTTLNSSTNGGITINLYSNNIISIAGTVILFAGIALLVAAVAFMIKQLWTSMQETVGGGAV